MLNYHWLYYICVSLILYPSVVQAQVLPDNTLPQNSEVSTQENIIQIDGGTEAGTNLFHSFEQFSLSEGNTALFNNDLAIENIFSRVTGGEISNINGLIQANGTANLLLVNPNGIIFGEQASLDVGGSFFASTAESILFEDDLQFSATNPEATPLLTVSVPIGLQFGSNPGTIINRSVTVDENDSFIGLQVPTDKTLGLIGGDVVFEGGIASAERGRIELGSISNDSFVNIASSRENFTLDYEGVENFADISFPQQSLLDVRGDGGGDIQIQGRQISISDSSQINASTIGSDSGGVLRIIASDMLELNSNSTIFVDVVQGAIGSGGDLNIVAPNLKITDGAFISVATFGSGNGGDVKVTSTDEVELSAGSIFVDVVGGATGNAGNLNFDVGKLRMANGSQVVTGTSSQGNGGELTVKANSIEINGTRTTESGRIAVTGLFASANNTPESTGEAGNIFLDTERLIINDGAQVFVGTFGSGNAGNLTVQSDYIELNGTSENNRISSGLLVDVQAGATGNAGNLTIESEQILINDGAQISAGTFGSGNGGNLSINSTDIEVIGRTDDNLNGSGIFAQVNPDATGNGGNLTINTSSLLIADGAQVSVATLGQGDAGNLTLQAEEVSVIGKSADDRAVSGLFSGVDSEAIGNGGNLILDTNTLRIADGANVLSSTFSSGNAGEVSVTAEQIIISNGGTLEAGSLLQPEFTEETIIDDIRGMGGNLTINASKSIEIDGTGIVGEAKINSSIFTRAEGTGSAGQLSIFTPKLTVANEGNINVSATGTGEAGSLTIEAGDIDLDRGNITAETRTGDRGNIILSNADSLLLRNNSQITTNASESATGGDITIAADVIAGLDNSDITANAVAGRGGNIQINTQGLFLEPDSEITASSELGIDGTITFNTPEVDPTSGLVELPDLPIDAAAILAQDVCKFEDEKIAGGSSFIITGRGGLTPTAEDSLSNRDRVVTWSNRDDLEVSNNGLVGIRQREVKQTAKDSYPVIQQSQGLIVASDGSVWLTANTPQAISQNSGIVHPNCETAPQSLEENGK